MVEFGIFRRRTFLGAVLAMIGYGASAQVMIFFLPLYLENAYGFEPLPAGIAMIPFALPMVLAPRITHQLATRFSGRSLLAAGLAITVVGNVAFWLVGRSHLPYGVFLVAMVIAGCGAGLLNGQTVKVLQGAVPEDRAGMASGLASTTRFIGILVSVAALGAILSDVARDRFVARNRRSPSSGALQDCDPTDERRPDHCRQDRRLGQGGSSRSRRRRRPDGGQRRVAFLRRQVHQPRDDCLGRPASRRLNRLGTFHP